MNKRTFRCSGTGSDLVLATDRILTGCVWCLACKLNSRLASEVRQWSLILCTASSSTFTPPLLSGRECEIIWSLVGCSLNCVARATAFRGPSKNEIGGSLLFRFTLSQKIFIALPFQVFSWLPYIQQEMNSCKLETLCN